jgi:hypothetical protein
MKKPKYTREWGAEHREEKKKKINKEVLWTAFIALIMVSSIIGFMWVGEDEPTLSYKDKYKFIRRNNVFIYRQANDEFIFRFLPNELEELAGDAELSNLNKPMFYVTFDPDSELIQSIELLRFELSDDLQKLDIFLGHGMTNESDDYNLPILDCEDATANVPIVKFAKANETRIREKDGCFIFEAKNDYDLAKLKDLILYSLLGIL